MRKKNGIKILGMKRMVSERKLFIDNTQEILIFFDSKGRIIDCNKQAISELGYEDDIFNLPVYYIFKKAFLYQDKQLKLDTKYQNSTAEAIAYRKNQTCFPVDLKVTYYSEVHPQVGLCSAINISDKKEMDQEIKNLKNELKSFDQVSTEFVANVTHELRTPINGILGFSNNLSSTPLDPNQIEAVNIIKRCCANMNAIINDLLDYAKISNNKLEFEQREFNFRNAIQQIIDMNKARINEKGLKLMVVIADDIPETVIGDELRLTQIINNLFSNSIKFTSVGRIGLEISKINEVGGTIELFFILFDTGIGISLEDRDKLFKSFSQVDSSITRRFGGTGLGLSISKKLVETMGGSITVESEKNKGSVFAFSIRLLIPSNQVDADPEQFRNKVDNMETGESGIETEDSPPISEIDYIKMRLNEANINFTQKSLTKENMREAIKNITILLDKLVICVEMENWETAEELASTVKGLIPKHNHDNLNKKVLSLLLAIRRENRNTSMELINDLIEDFKEIKNRRD